MDVTRAPYGLWLIVYRGTLPSKTYVQLAGGWTVVLFVSPKNISLVFVYYMWLTLCSRLTPFPPSPHFLPRKETQDGSGSIVWKEEDSRRDAQTKPKSTQQGQSNHVHIFTCGEAGSVAKNLIPSPLHLTLARYLFTFFFFMFSINRWYGNSTGSVPAWSVRRKS